MAAKILIVEDDIFTAENTAAFLNEKGYETRVAHNSEEAWKSILVSLPDLILMDIDLSGETDGIELAARINQRQRVPVIYLTDKNDERIVKKAQNVHHAYYMTKPFHDAILLSQVELVLRENAGITVNLQALFVKDRTNESRKIKVPFEDICYLHAQRSYCDLYYLPAGEKEPKKLELSINMATTLQKLPRQQFVQVHRSYSINLRKIEALDTNDILICGTPIPVGKSYQKNISELLNQV